MTASKYGRAITLACATILSCLFTKAQQADTAQRASAAAKPVQSLQEVVVTGQYGARSVRNSVYRVRTINQDRIGMRGATDVMGVLNNELGFRFSTDNTLGETDIRIMGMGGARVKVLLDGVPLVDRDATRQSLGQIDVNSIERIEIVEGPMSVVYGSDALAGVINIITKKGNKDDGIRIAARIQEESAGNSYSPINDEGLHNENLTLSWQQKAWRIAAWGTRNDFGGWNDTAAWPAKTWKPKQQWMTGGTIGFRGRNISATYRLDYLNEEIYAAGVMFTSSYAGQDQYYITNRFTHIGQVDWNLNDRFSINTSLSYQDYKRSTETYAIDYRAGTKTKTEGDGYWDVSKFHTYFWRSTAQWRISPLVSVQPGVEVKYDKTTGQRVSGTPSITDYSFFASAEIAPVGGVLLRPGVRFSNNSVYDAPPVIPSLNTKFILSDKLDLRLSYARGFRAPILRELYFYFHDASHSIDGNPNLKAEYSNSYNGSLTWSSNVHNVRLSSAVTGFFNDYRDFINLAYDASSQSYTYFNTTRYKTVGGTFDNNLSWKNLTVTLGFSYIGYYNEYADDKTIAGNHSKYAWAPEVNSNITYRFPKLDGTLGFYYKFNGALPSYALNADGDIYLSKINSYHWADITATKKLYKYFTLQGGVKNLFNIRRVQNSSTDVGSAHSTGGPVLTAYGTSFFLGVHINWSK